MRAAGTHNLFSMQKFYILQAILFASFTLYAALIIKEAMDVTLSHINLTCKEILS